LDPNVRKKNRGSTMIFHLDDEGGPIRLNDVAEVTRA
jgi:hypothetical protein